MYVCIDVECSSLSLCRDYQSIPRLDTYDAGNLDEGDYDTIDPAARVAAERELKKRDRQVQSKVYTVYCSC